MFANIEEVVKKQVLEIGSKMGLYLQNSSSRTILFKPIKLNILEAHGQVLSLLDFDYTPEEAAQVPILNLPDLQSFLDGLCRVSSIFTLYCRHHIICHVKILWYSSVLFVVLAHCRILFLNIFLSMEYFGSVPLLLSLSTLFGRKKLYRTPRGVTLAWFGYELYITVFLFVNIGVWLYF